MIITIDGPTASGKSTLAQRIAEKLHIYYVNTGLLYRALAFIMMRDYGVTLADLEHPDSALVATVLTDPSFTYRYDAQQGAQVYYKGESITPFLKTATMDTGSSVISKDSGVRSALLTYQRHLAAQHSIVADGRDCGTVVFPQAEYKFFITADPKVRAERWYADQRARGKQVTHEEAYALLMERDARDAGRASAPLTCPVGAWCLDATYKTLDELEAQMIEIITQKRA